jgi:tyrosinase
VKCLTILPSSLHYGLSSLYEDFPWIHSYVGYNTHNSAPFLPWHRYFLHIYETSLKTQCNYTGSLVYWDWSLDWEHLELSPIFNPDPENGFGTDGDPSEEIAVGKTGRCVVDGAFNDIEASY